jgi:hypothetical protein
MISKPPLRKNVEMKKTPGVFALLPFSPSDGKPYHEKFYQYILFPFPHIIKKREKKCSKHVQNKIWQKQFSIKKPQRTLVVPGAWQTQKAMRASATVFNTVTNSTAGKAGTTTGGILCHIRGASVTLKKKMKCKNLIIYMISKICYRLQPKFIQFLKFII